MNAKVDELPVKVVSESGWTTADWHISANEMGALLQDLSVKPYTQLLYYGFLPQNEQNPGQLLAVVGEPHQSKVTWYFGELHKGQSSFPSLANTWPAALWTEREIWERYGILPKGHPDLRPILQPEQDALRGVAKGSGVFYLPLGPVRGDVNESVSFLFDTIGEQIMHMQPQLFYKQRDIEQLAIGQEPQDVLLLAERISGTSTVAHATAFCRATEQAMGWQTDPHVELERALYGELERLYNHAHDFAQMASTSGMTVGQAQLSRVKEECLRLNAALTGSRYLRNAVRLAERSGVDFAEISDYVQTSLSQVDSRLQRFTSLLLHTPTFVDRLRTTGILQKDWATQYGVVGPVARACGAAVDSRLDYLLPLYQGTGYQIALPEMPTGDAYDRFLVRLLEWNNSVAIVRQILDELQGQKTPKDFGTSPKRFLGIGMAESPRGRVAHVVRIDHTGSITYWGIRAASSWNWPIIGLTTANGNIQTDFPVIEASFGLSVAGIDR